MDESNRWLGPILFLAFVYLVQILLVQSMFIAVISDLYSDILDENNLAWERVITVTLIRKYIVEKSIFDRSLFQYLYWIQMLTGYLHKEFVKRILDKFKGFSRKGKGGTTIVRWKEDDFSKHLNEVKKEESDDKLEEFQKEVQSQFEELEKKAKEQDAKLEEMLTILRTLSAKQ